jgi:hypothetical protein
MSTAIYTPTPASIGKFLAHIQEAGVPQKVTTRHLQSVGFKSTNDRQLVTIMKGIGFIDQAGNPTDTWKAYKDKGHAKTVLAGALRVAYADLFSTYPDAYRKDDEALYNYFASKTGLAKATVDLMVRSFKAFCERADFESEGPTVPPPAAVNPPLASNGRANAAQVPSVNINIELHLPPTDDADVYEKLFAAMKKHLFPCLTSSQETTQQGCARSARTLIESWVFTRVLNRELSNLTPRIRVSQR